MHVSVLSEVIGWCGAAAIVAAYALSSFKVLSQGSAPYQALNAVGAAGVVYISLLKTAWQPFTLNVIWFVVAAIALVRLTQRPQKSANS